MPQEPAPDGWGGRTAVLILAAGWVVSKGAQRATIRAAEKGRLDAALGAFLGQIARYTVLAAALISALGRVGIETTSLVAVLASAGLAVGLALQGSLANFASGVMILFFRPLNLGDVVEAGGATGEVRDIGLFATTLVNLDNHTIILPNAAVTGGNIVNYTRQGMRRGQVDVGVAYGADLQHVERVLLAALKDLPLVIQAPPPALAFTEMGASSLNFKLMVWCKPEDYRQMMHDVRSAAYNALNAAKIEIPFPQVVVHRAAVAGEA